jgi:hypothetical protein
MNPEPRALPFLATQEAQTIAGKSNRATGKALQVEAMPCSCAFPVNSTASTCYSGCKQMVEGFAAVSKQLLAMFHAELQQGSCHNPFMRHTPLK